MSAPPTAHAPHDPYAALRIANYRDYLIGSMLSMVARQAVVAVAIWQVYAWTHSAAMLGFVGVINVAPLLVLLLPAGALADRHDRKGLIAAGTAALAVLNAGLAMLALAHSAVPALAPLRWGNAPLHTLRPDK